MPKEYGLHIIMQKSAQQPSRILIGEMPSVTQNPLLQIIRIFSNLQHPDIMIRLQKKRIQIQQMIDYVLIILSKVCSNPHGMLSAFHTVPYRLCRIMRDHKRIHCQIPDLKRFIFMNLMENPFRDLTQIHLRQRLQSSSRCINRNLMLSCNHAQTFDMI